MPLQSNSAVEIKLDSTDSNLTAKQKTMMTNWFTTVPKFEATPEMLSAKSK